MKPKVSERTFYPPLMNLIEKTGGSSVSEIQLNSVPDILFNFEDNTQWILSVKIGQDTATLKEGLLQYWRHRDEAPTNLGMILFLPESVRSVDATPEQVNMMTSQALCRAVVDSPVVKEEWSGVTFPEILTMLKQRVLPKLRTRTRTHYSLNLVISLLQRQVEEIMAGIDLSESTILHIITDAELLTEIAPEVEADDVDAVARFLASYILLSQLLFLRLLVSARPELIPFSLRPATHMKLRHAFKRILEINYRDIYRIDVLDTISDTFVRDTFDLIWGLEVEQVRYELPGRIFHELMPWEIRKLLASFYTRPHAADLLSRLAISGWNELVFDPACGSGTILVSAYRRKRQLHDLAGLPGNPHKRFAEDEIFGADIMPFAVHLTAANIAALDAAETIERTQLIQGDTLELAAGESYATGVHQSTLFPTVSKAKTSEGELYDIDLRFEQFDAILMNPPFTKVERGISEFVDMDRFSDRVGGEVGLWGHFIAFSHLFLKPEGIYGGVIPINVLRGRESTQVREILFHEWEPLFILKPTINYAFSEWSEYRDVIFIARKRQTDAKRATVSPPSPDHQVKFCLVKQDLTRITDKQVNEIVHLVRNNDSYRSDLVDVDSYLLQDLDERFANLMWFVGGIDFDDRDRRVAFVGQAFDKLDKFPDDSSYSFTGYRPASGVAQFMFVTRPLDSTRTMKATLTVATESEGYVEARSEANVVYLIERHALLPSLRTPVGVSTMDIGEKHDYIAQKPYDELAKVYRAVGIRNPRSEAFWQTAQAKLKRTQSKLLIVRRINPYSPNHHLIAFYSDDPIAPSDQLNVIMEEDSEKAKALCVVFNSIFFLVQFFQLKEESTGRYIDLRLYDLAETYVMPSTEAIPALVEVFEAYRNVQFPSLHHQLDENFQQRYDEFQESQEEFEQMRLLSVLDKPVQPFPERLAYDLAVADALGVNVSEADILYIYESIIDEMLMVRSLKRD